MLTRLLLVGVLAGTGAGGLLGQTSSVPFDWASLVGGAVGSSPAAIVLAWRLNKADKETTSLRDELRSMHSQNIQMIEKLAPLIVESTRTLVETTRALTALKADRPVDANLARQIHTLTQTLERDRRGGT